MDADQILIAGVGGLGCAWAKGANMRKTTGLTPRETPRGDHTRTLHNTAMSWKSTQHAPHATKNELKQEILRALR